mgnify:CR=1 FL=1
MPDTRTILLVEDDPMSAAMEAMYLEDAGYSVITAGSGSKAVELGFAMHIDLVLMDIDLGTGMDGTEAARQILAERDLPLIFLSSHTEPEIVERTETITSYGYIVKSMSSAVLLASIRMAFRLHEARERADEQERFFRGIFEQAPVGMQVFDSSGTALMVNRAWENLWQTTASRVIGVYNIYEDANLRENGYLQYFERAFRGESVMHPDMEYDPVKNGYVGRKRVVRSVVFPIMLRGTVHRVVLISQDMTEVAARQAELVQAKELAEAGEQQMALLLELAPDAFFRGDSRGDLVSVNTKACDLTGYSREELLEMNIGRIFTPESIKRRPLDYVTLNAGGIITTTRDILRRDGSTVPVEMSSRRMPDGTYQSFMRDISDRENPAAPS